MTLFSMLPSALARKASDRFELSESCKESSSHSIIRVRPRMVEGRKRMLVEVWFEGVLCQAFGGSVTVDSSCLSGCSDGRQPLAMGGLPSERDRGARCAGYLAECTG